MRPSLGRRVVAEGLGTAFLLAAVVGSGIMGERLAGGNVALALLPNALATGAVLLALLLTFGKVSGAHFNPVVSLASIDADFPWEEAAIYVVAQVTGAMLGVMIAHGMFEIPLAVSTHTRAGGAQVFSEAVATFGLLFTIQGVGRLQPASVPTAVAAYVVGAYWFTASTAFANPAVTLARCLTNTFTGIRPQDAPAFIIAQLVGAAAAVGVGRWLFGDQSP